jgi:hypothetical protein
MKRYIALLVSLVLALGTGPGFAGFLDTLKGLIPGHHEKQPVRHSHPRSKSRTNPGKPGKPEESPSPDAEASPEASESPSPSPVPVESAESSPDNSQATADQSPKPLSSPQIVQNSTTTAPSVAIDPPPLY